ncbi:MAG TPA: DUF308 domain-containing protein [Luteitalea sp.]|nr:DUF308 domain-containing protein [Luteitalea sp.]
MFSSLSTSLVVRGILAVVVGIVAIAWPSVTILALVILFAVYAFMDAGIEAARAFSSANAGPVFGHLLLGLLDVAAGVLAIAWPGITALALTIVVGVWAFIGGIIALSAAFMSGETAGTRAMLIVDGLVMIAFGVVLFAAPNVGAVTLALLFGLFSLIFGVTQIVTGAQLRRGGSAFDQLTPNAV